tara:strand:+ start:46 stop:2181 length:2136 start_codon:yes stop_codon:yes gene_type:complete
MEYSWPLQEDVITEEDQKNLIEFINTTKRYTQFTKVKEFERAFSEWQECKYSVYVNSGSSANLLLIDVLKEKYGWDNESEIMVPAITWVTNISPIIQLGLKPVFLDVNISDFSFDYEKIKEKITDKTKAIFITHLMGFPSNIRKIREIIGGRDIKIIEDCCESHGAKLDGIKIGNHGLAGTFSFYWGHHITSIEGGIICTNDEDLYHRFLLKRSHGLARELPKELHESYKNKYPHIDFEFLFLTGGYNFRNTEFNAVLGLSQLKRLNQFIEIRNNNYRKFFEICQKYPSELIITDNPGISSFCLPFIFKNKDKMQLFKERLKKEGIQTRPIISGNLLRQPFLSEYSSNEMKNAEYLHQHAFYVGNNQFVNDERLSKLGNIIEDFFKTKMDKDSKIYISGHTGLVGSAILEILKDLGYQNIITRTHEQLDLTNPIKVEQFFQEEKPEFVFLAAAKVGGIKANMSQPAEFIYDNLQIQNNVIHNAYKSGVKKLLYLGSVCVYPTNSQQPIKEEYLMEGKFEPTNEAFSIAKLSGIGMCQSYNKQYGTNFISVIPSNVYGPNDNFDPAHAHMVSSLITKFHKAKTENQPSLELWGTGTPRRDLLYVKDLAKALIFLMQNYNSNEPINIGTGTDLEIKEIAEIIRETTGYSGQITFNPEKPNGMMKRQLDVSKINALGWNSETSFRNGIRKTYEWYLSTLNPSMPSHSPQHLPQN